MTVATNTTVTVPRAALDDLLLTVEALGDLDRIRSGGRTDSVLALRIWDALGEFEKAAGFARREPEDEDLEHAREAIERAREWFHELYVEDGMDG